VGSRLLAAILALAAAGGVTPVWGGVAPGASPAAEALPPAGQEAASSIQVPAPARQLPCPPESGGLRQALAARLLAVNEGAIPPEPRRETPPGTRKSFFRSRVGVVLMIVAGAILVGSAAKNSILEDP